MATRHPQAADGLAPATARAHFEEESSKAELYRQLARKEPNPDLRAGLQRLGELESRQAAFWAGFLPDKPLKPPELRARERTLKALAGRVGTRALLPLFVVDAQQSVRAYQAEPEAAAALDIEHEVELQAAALAGLTRDSPQVTDLARDHRRQVATNGSLRAAVFGINDGLVSNVSLVMGVAGAAPPNEFILLAGLAGLLAGAFSMAGGEFISMLSHREVLERQIDIERHHIQADPASETALLAQRLLERGVPEDHAHEVAGHLMEDPDRALDAIAREQLGLDPHDLGSPTAAAGASFVAFALGATIAPAPFLFASGWPAVIMSAAVSAVGLFLVGTAVSFFTGRHWFLSGARMLAVGTAAALVTFVIGRLIGISVA